MIGDAARFGAVVLANAQIDQTMTGPTGRCPPPEPCHGYFLPDVSGRNDVAIGWRMAPEGEGTRYEDDIGVRWLTPLSVPGELGLFAFRILAEAVEYLGPVIETAEGEVVWKVDDVNAGEHADLVDDLYAVEGWLVQTPMISCPAPNDYGPDTEMAYWCGGSFVTQARVETYTSDQGVLLDPGGLHVQWSAYDDFALNPQPDPNPELSGPSGVEPRFGTYLVRSVGCQAVTAGDCPVWSMVGRFDDLTPPQGDVHLWPAEIAGEAVFTTDAALARVQSSTSAESFLVGGHVYFAQGDCFVPPDFPMTPLLAPCGDGFQLSPSRRPLGGGFRLVLVADVPLAADGEPVVLRVHGHDPLAAQCPADYQERCATAIVVDELVWSATIQMPAPTVAAGTPTLAVGNWTTLRVSVFVNGMDAAILDPGEVVDPISPGMLPALPWHIEAATSNGRVLLTLTVREGDVWHSSPDPSGGSASHGAAARAELSCGRLDIWSGPPLLGPIPPPSFPPGDCDP